MSVHVHTFRFFFLRVPRLVLSVVCRGLACKFSCDPFDVAGNKIGSAGLKLIIKLSLMENSSIIAFDARLNPGCSELLDSSLQLHKASVSH